MATPTQCYCSYSRAEFHHVAVGRVVAAHDVHVLRYVMREQHGRGPHDETGVRFAVARICVGGLRLTEMDFKQRRLGATAAAGCRFRERQAIAAIAAHFDLVSAIGNYETNYFRPHIPPPRS